MLNYLLMNQKYHLNQIIGKFKFSDFSYEKVDEDA